MGVKLVRWGMTIIKTKKQESRAHIVLATIEIADASKKLPHAAGVLYEVAEALEPGDAERESTACALSSRLEVLLRDVKALTENIEHAAALRRLKSIA